YWIMGDYLYEVSGNIDKNELIRISEGIS
ncbi:MAG: DUF4367 domain-containing protein, partial [Eubacterium sp.]|nr:DUF4367 domain-containing protein [Eubacterium sp.]